MGTIFSKVRPAGLVAALLLTLICSANGQQEGVDLSFRGGHVAVLTYQVSDGVRGTNLQDFVLLGCEAGSGMRAGGVHDVLMSLLFAPVVNPKMAGQQWGQEHIYFADSLGLVEPLKAQISFKLTRVGKVSADEILKVVKGKGLDGAAAFVLDQGAVLEGSVSVFRGLWVDRKVRWDDRKAVLTMRFQRLVDLSDGKVVAASYQASGKGQEFLKLGSAGLNVAVEESRGLRLSRYVSTDIPEQVNGAVPEAIARGTKWLLAQQGADGSFGDRSGYPIATLGAYGSTGLAVEALLHAGVPSKDPRIMRAFAFLGSRKSSQSYDQALLLSALEAKYLSDLDPRVLEKLSEQELRVDLQKRVSGNDRELAALAAAFLVDCQAKDGSFGYTRGHDELNFSSMQYALLGLRAASRLGIRVQPFVWRKAFKCLLSREIPVGREMELSLEVGEGRQATRKLYPIGWQYYSSSVTGASWSITPTTTMVTAAISSLSIVRGEQQLLNDWDAASEVEWDRLSWGGWGWVSSTFSIRASHPGGLWWGPGMLYYHLFSLERAGILSNVKTAQNHHWYHEGASVLLAAQDRAGNWGGVQGCNVVDTSFALLFLKRAVLYKDVATQSIPNKKP